MRTAMLAALALASACGSSSPEVAPPPAPAPAPAAASALRASIVATEQYYDIDGSSAGALRDQINRLGPKDESGKSRDALTVWSIEWGSGRERPPTSRSPREALADPRGLAAQSPRRVSASLRLWPFV